MQPSMTPSCPSTSKEFSLDHVKAESLCRTFITGERVSLSDMRTAVELTLQMLDYSRAHNGYQRCEKHGAVNLASRWTCPLCYQELLGN